MKIKLDENLPARLKAELSARGHDVDTVIDEALTGQSDDKVWLAAQSEARFLITQDLDFSDMRKFKPGSHAGVLILRLHAPGAQALLERVTAVSEDLNSWQGCFVVLSENKLRIKHPA